MDEDAQLVNEIKRGDDAKRLLESPIYQEAWAIVETEIVRRWKESPIADLDGQHELRLMLQVLASVKAQLDEVMTTGKLARVQREQKQTLMDRMRNWRES